MYRAIIVLLSIFAVLHQSNGIKEKVFFLLFVFIIKNVCQFFFLCISGEAIRCYTCTSLIDPYCNDKFSNHSLSVLMDCSLKSVYDLTPITQCRKIVHKGKSFIVIFKKKKKK